MLKINNLTKAYGQRPVLQGLDLWIDTGEIYGLLGPNGAGKTTTINILCNLLQADGGAIEIAASPLSEATKKIIGVAPQENLLYKTLTCAENLRFYGRIYGLSKQACQAQIGACLEAVGLGDRHGAPVETLSGGMQRRMNIAIALMHRPQLLILDEPTTGLDIETRYEIWQLIQRLRDEGMTILLTTHLLDEAQRLCQRIGILKGGQIIAEGTLPELRQRIPAKEVVLLQTTDREGAIAKGTAAGFTQRNYGGDLAFWLPEALELSDILDIFQGIPIDSIARQGIQLEHIYVEILSTGQKLEKDRGRGFDRN
ncbi:ABC transporter ATP-binding protein [Picosynechococcus sp. PCC 11901]|uniref:ABC transporter ATP-binding protein n=1 Tax=Picosynechococcus sp. PCC 11901 TaxID=2579791 RepID=UPI0010FBE737|nr:ABC transporter ATP-binding protein [Picosynechococcus sp. PCC 11901]QCS48890.1 ABC transporter ATP-binding protein [Picosynechococcus sp. PCC 11901]